MLRLLIENTLDREEKIMAEWIEKSLGEIAEVTKLAGFEFTKYIKYNDDGEIIALRALNLRNGELDLSDIKRISREVSEGLTRSKIYKDDILLTYTGNGYGDCAIIEENDKYHLAPNICKIVPNQNVIYPYYLYCYIRSKAFYNQMSNNMTGSGQPTIPMKTIRLLKIPVPDMSVQVKIANMIRSLNQKIRNNKVINNNLFEQMQALYKAWFVDFEPFGGVRPSNWNDTNIYAIANIIYGAPFASKLFNTDGLGKPIIRIRDLKEQAFVTFTTEEHPKGHLIQPGDIVVGMDGEFRPYIWGNEPAWLNQRVCIFESNRPQGKAFVLYTIKPLLNKIEQTQVATTVIHIGKKDFDAFEIILPDEATLDSFDSITAPMIEQIVNNRLQNKRLAVLRDTLLPKLMSGELDVSNIEL